MGYRHKKKDYGDHRSWREWRDANATRLAAAKIPSIALESEWNWGFFLQEATPTLMGGPPFEVDSLTDVQLADLHRILQSIPEQASGGDLLASVERAVAARQNRKTPQN